MRRAGWGGDSGLCFPRLASHAAAAAASVKVSRAPSPSGSNSAMGRGDRDADPVQEYVVRVDDASLRNDVPRSAGAWWLIRFENGVPRTTARDSSSTVTTAEMRIRKTQIGCSTPNSHRRHCPTIWTMRGRANDGDEAAGSFASGRIRRSSCSSAAGLRVDDVSSHNRARLLPS